jgi:hypothetical protein
MNHVKWAIIPGIAISSIFLFLIAQIVFTPDQVVIASAYVDEHAISPQVELPTENIDCSLSLTFPQGILQWCGLIDKYAMKYGIPAKLVAAVILQESGGDPTAYSTSGAVGLMQVMPKDGLAASFMCANGPCFINRPTISELSDPEFNIDYGVRMLAGLIDRSSGIIREGLKAYGPFNVEYYYADKVMSIFESY